MEVKPIKTEADYQAALKEIESLVHAAPGSTQSDRLNALSSLVEAYEQEHYDLTEPNSRS